LSMTSNHRRLVISLVLNVLARHFADWCSTYGYGWCSWCEKLSSLKCFDDMKHDIVWREPILIALLVFV
jgi:hypothetical protein